MARERDIHRLHLPAAIAASFVAAPPPPPPSDDLDDCLF
jgi:hypothetical protein